MLIPIPSLVRAGNLDSFLKVGLKFYVFFTLNYLYYIPIPYMFKELFL